VIVTFDFVVAAVVVAAEVDLLDEPVLVVDFEVVEVVELVVVGAVLEEEAAAVVAGGGITLKLTVAPHSARDKSLSQQPASVQYSPAEQ